MKKEFGKLLFAPWGAKNKNYGSAQISENIFRKIFREVIVFDPQEELYKNGKRAMNQKFLDTVINEKPDFVFLWLIYEEFYLDTLIKIKEISPNTKIINFFGDDDSLYESYSRFYAPLFDCSLVFQKDKIKNYKKDKIENVFSTIGVDLDYYKPIKCKKIYDVTFIGTPKKDRYDYIKYLIDNRISIEIYGAGWENYSDLARYYRGKLSKEDLVKVINQSKINLSFSKNYLGKMHYVGRVIEIAACKSFVISEYFEGYYGVLDKNQLKMFEDKKGLLEKVRYYLKNENEREEIVKNAYERAIKEYSLEDEIIFALNNIKVKKINEKIYYDKINKKEVFYITKEILKENSKFILDKIKDYEYVGFKDKENIFLPYKEQIQIMSLKNSKKNISLCDYYVHSKYLGDFLVFNSKSAYENLASKDFFRVCNLGQVILKKEFFLRNMIKFKENFKSNFENLFKNEELCFVDMPLVKVKNIADIGSNKLQKAFMLKFEDNIRSLYHKNLLFISPYIYRLILRSILKERFIIKSLVNRFVKAIYLKLKRK